MPQRGRSPRDRRTESRPVLATGLLLGLAGLGAVTLAGAAAAR
jgi:hypothetical protein